MSRISRLQRAKSKPAISNDNPAIAVRSSTRPAFPRRFLWELEVDEGMNRFSKQHREALPEHQQRPISKHGVRASRRHHHDAAADSTAAMQSSTSQTTHVLGIEEQAACHLHSSDSSHGLTAQTAGCRRQWMCEMRRCSDLTTARRRPQAVGCTRRSLDWLGCDCRHDADGSGCAQFTDRSRPP